MSGQSYLCEVCRLLIEPMGPVWLDLKNRWYSTKPIWHRHKPRGDQ